VPPFIEPIRLLPLFVVTAVPMLITVASSALALEVSFHAVARAFCWTPALLSAPKSVVVLVGVVVLVCVVASCVAVLSTTNSGRGAGTVVLALLAAPAEASIDLVEERTSDANPTGSGSQFSAYLRAHRDGARYETAAANPLSVVGLIAQDAQPVLVLRSIDGVLVSVPELRHLVSQGAVRFVILPHPCSSGRHCTPTTAWSVRNSVMVRPGLYRYVALRHLPKSSPSRAARRARPPG